MHAPTVHQMAQPLGAARRGGACTLRGARLSAVRPSRAEHAQPLLRALLGGAAALSVVALPMPRPASAAVAAQVQAPPPTMQTVQQTVAAQVARLRTALARTTSETVRDSVFSSSALVEAVAQATMATGVLLVLATLWARSMASQASRTDTSEAATDAKSPEAKLTSRDTEAVLPVRTAPASSPAVAPVRPVANNPTPRPQPSASAVTSAATVAAPMTRIEKFEGEGPSDAVESQPSAAAAATAAEERSIDVDVPAPPATPGSQETSPEFEGGVEDKDAPATLTPQATTVTDAETSAPAPAAPVESPTAAAQPTATTRGPSAIAVLALAAGQALDVATALAVAGAMVIRPFTTSQNVLRDPDVRRILSKLDLVQEIATSPQPLRDPEVGRVLSKLDMVRDVIQSPGWSRPRGEVAKYDMVGSLLREVEAPKATPKYLGFIDALLGVRAPTGRSQFDMWAELRGTFTSGLAEPRPSKYDPYEAFRTWVRSSSRRGVRDWEPPHAAALHPPPRDPREVEDEGRRRGVVKREKAFADTVFA